MTEQRTRPPRRVRTAPAAPEAAPEPAVQAPAASGSRSTQFSKTRQPEYRHTGERARARLIKALNHVMRKRKDANGRETGEYMTEDSYLQEVVEASFTDPKIMLAILQRLSPTAKSLAPTVAINFPKTGSPVEKMEAVLHAVTDGDISPDVGITITSMIKQTVDVNEVTELMDRMAKLEEAIRQQAAEKNEGRANG